MRVASGYLLLLSLTALLSSAFAAVLFLFAIWISEEK